MKFRSSFRYRRVFPATALHNQKLSLVIFICLFTAGIASGAELHQASFNFLQAKYSKIEPLLQKNVFNMPLHVESREESSRAWVDVYGIIEQPFELMSTVLSKPENWCEIALLHINNKACIYTQSEHAWQLTLYSGRKYYQHPADAHQLHFAFHVKAQSRDYLALQLSAPDGPLSTIDHRINAEMIPLPKGKTFIHLSYAFGFGTLGRLAMKSYFATLGRNKIGFSTTGTTEHGAPVHVAGIQGAIERNVVRYYCAILAYLDSLKYPGDQQFEKRISRWFDLTDHHKKQLHEIGKDSYLSNKRLEHKNQVTLQKKSGKPAPSQP